MDRANPLASAAQRSQTRCVARPVVVFASVVASISAAWACGTNAASQRPAGSGGSSASGGTASGGTDSGSMGGTGADMTGGAGPGGAGPGGAGPGGAGPGGAGPGGSGPSDAARPDVRFEYDAVGGTGGLTQDGACATTSVEGTLDFAPADIIFAVDTSGSMSQEQQWAQQQMPNFVNAITASGIDVHVVLIAGTDMCVPAPLGSGTCNGTDTKLPNYLHVNVGVGSNDALNKFITTFPQWRSMLRPNSVKSFVVVSDDDATDGPNNSAAAFTASVNALDPTLIQPGWKFHGIVSSAGPFSGACFLLSAAEGKVYKNLIAQTGGVFGDLCAQNFAPVFTQLATSVVNSAPLGCDIAMPTTDAGIIDPDEVKIELTLPPNPPQLINNVTNAGNCGGGGWYYDNPGAPTQIKLCQSTCDAANAVANPKVNVLLGCLGS